MAFALRKKPGWGLPKIDERRPPARRYAGVLSAQVDIDTWQEAAKVTLAFGQQVTLKEVWGALLDEIDEEGALSELSPASQQLLLLPRSVCLCYYCLVTDF